MAKFLFILGLASLWANVMDYPLFIEGEDDPLYIGVSLISEVRGYSYIDSDSEIYSEGSFKELKVQDQVDWREGVKLEAFYRDISFRAAYFDSHLQKAIDRAKTGQKEDIFRKEDIAKFLEVAVLKGKNELSLVRAFNNYGTYTLGSQDPQRFTTSSTKVIYNYYFSKRPGGMGFTLVGEESRNLRLLRIGRTGDKGQSQLLRTYGPFNNEVKSLTGGFIKNPDPSGRLYVTSAFRATIGASESPLGKNYQIDLPGHYLLNEGYDLVGDFYGALVTGVNIKWRGLRLRGSVMGFVDASYSSPGANVLPNGITPDNVPENEDIEDYYDMFTEEYSDWEMEYGAAFQLKVIF